jgi:hypothetical protein
MEQNSEKGLASAQGWETARTWNPALLLIDESDGERKTLNAMIVLHGLVH